MQDDQRKALGDGCTDAGKTLGLPAAVICFRVILKPDSRNAEIVQQQSVIQTCRIRQINECEPDLFSCPLIEINGFMNRSGGTTGRTAAQILAGGVSPGNGGG